MVSHPDAGDLFSIRGILDRFLVIALVEAGQVEDLGGLTTPKTDVIAVFGVISGDGHVVRNGLDAACGNPFMTGYTVLILCSLDMASKTDLD